MLGCSGTCGTCAVLVVPGPARGSRSSPCPFSPSVCARLPVEVVTGCDSLVTVARGAGEREGFQDEGRERGWGEWRWRAGAESFPGTLEVGPCVS